MTASNRSRRYPIWRYLMMPLALAGMLSVSSAAELNPAAVTYKLPDQIPWGPVDARGAQNAVVVGDPAKPGFYVVLNRFHPGYFSHPHYHANDRYIMVLSGTWWAATGGKDDPEHITVPIKAGSFAVHKGKEVHYDGARSGQEEAIVMIFGEGPGTRHECYGPMAEKTPGPCTEALKAAGVN